MNRLYLIYVMVLCSIVALGQTQSSSKDSTKKEKEVEIYEQYPLNLRKVSQIKQLMSYPAIELLELGVSKQELDSKTMIKSEQSNGIAVVGLLSKNKIIRKVSVKDFSYNFLGKEIYFTFDNKDKEVYKSNSSYHRFQFGEVLYFEIKRGGMIEEYYRIEGDLYEVNELKTNFSGQRGAKVQSGQTKRVDKVLKHLDTYARQLLSSRYVNIYEVKEIEKVIDLYEENRYYVLKFNLEKEKKFFYLSRDSEKSKKVLLWLFNEFRVDIEKFIEEKQLFRNDKVTDKEILGFINYIVSEKYPKIRREKDYEVLEVEIR